MATSDPNDNQADDIDVFNIVADSDPLTRKERLFRWIDLNIFTPYRIIRSDWRASFGIAMIIFLVFVGTVVIRFIPYPRVGDYPRYAPPFQSLAYPLGTDNGGRGILAQLVHATPDMLIIAFSGAVVAMSIGVVIGTVAGYKGGYWDEVLMGISDVVICIPGLPLIIVIVAIYPPTSPWLVGFILAIDNWPGLARALRSQVLTIREESYIEAGRAMGRNSGEILWDDVMPQLMPYITIRSAGAARGVIFQSVGLYFIGVLPQGGLNWGVMMNDAYNIGSAVSNPGLSGHWLYAPMFVLLLMSMGLILLSQGLDRIFNPRLRARHEKKASEKDEIEVDL
ncbi:ABC transporter permease [Halobacteria archaeon AArc-curdl1]|uniref:ABC transporter permease n=1 Tax=Natronosalvus hydrolyticus TaxID=2979988 RepID=A0AAP3E6C9_9EURY|nr:ABC transporter permease [Halobacteria archaeon AArc-curdl1]